MSAATIERALQNKAAGNAVARQHLLCDAAFLFVLETIGEIRPEMAHTQTPERTRA
jgi:hypothetical protein